MNKNISKVIKTIGLGIVLGIVVIGSVACGSGKENASKEATPKEVKIGVVGANNDVWDYVAKKLEKEDGIKVKLVKFSDYNQPNKALSAGDLDLNSFQHRIFLENYNKESNDNLTPIGDTVIAPLGIYSDKVKNANDIKQGGKIIIPNDVTNEARALKLLESAGLIKLDPNGGDFSTPKNIKENPKKLEIIPVDASQTARSIKDADEVIINSGIAVDAGLIPTKDAIFLEQVNEKSKPYINIIVARAKDKDNKVYKKIVEAYQTDDVKKVINETSKGSSIPAWEDKK
ncbi:MetQ/NlpA family ABC transporter substrate-binding protein [Clostridium perfringens]|uniref:MetQ/NlpA family ABC transporter substrate-binding protein n=1 Tax=Clostridium perfringens TaxID=1502 RepID=UPI0018E47956|nr:MetQ/NlpA family ABC transporter substrate-binding protein [Clostridium perfringens]ELC8332958.1 MetQ/NlpA family ABC transporter substrate-binding protein [Clostridium perfringens]ELC8423029.1 MetQ/NlpA family ABC transporter substrate-binding protein [Clostridium perfringens]ELC8451431.1 MetQ/NlpA family ABC transporter substrate-binding protein [Clostridium perfringens]MBI6030733.1 MetQ/NlpA family ABC transporter substrate-binding protein [Clostridium perfringens]MBI6034064.1 MetQ/NlpA 